MMEIIIGAAAVVISALGGAWGLGASLNRKFDSTDERLSKLEHSIDLLKKQSEFEKTLLEQKVVAALDRTNDAITNIQVTIQDIHKRLEQVTRCVGND